MQLILFGLSGSGKNYVGEILAKEFGYHFWDGDSVLTGEMRDCIKNKQPFTQTMRDTFTAVIINHINRLTKEYVDVVIAQGFYKERNRCQIQHAVPAAQLVHIHANLELIQNRLRKHHETDYLDYAKKISLNFEAPQLPHHVINNETDEQSVIEQLDTLLHAENISWIRLLLDA